MIQCFAARFGCLQGDRELLLGLGLADELGEALGPELQLDGVIIVHASSRNQTLGVGVRAVHVERFLLAREGAVWIEAGSHL